MPEDLKRKNIIDIKSRKNSQPLVVLTAYTAPQARIIDDYVDIILVGDSLGMVLYGMDSTLSVTVSMMVAHGKAVVNSSKKALVVVDLPFGSYQQSEKQAFRTAARIMAQTGCNAVKLEGGKEMAKTVKFLTERGIPVMGHIGLKPQSVNSLGGYRTQGKSDIEITEIMADAKAVEDAGAFCLVIEGVVEEAARKVTERLVIPTIGIGASPACDGQVLVSDDMLGMSGGYVPRFVKKYADISDISKDAVKKYAEEVRLRKFPSSEYYYPYRK